MSRQRLARGVKIEWNGYEFLIEERLSNGKLRLTNKQTEERRTIDENSLVEALFQGNLQILGLNNESQNLNESIQKNRVFDFTALDDTDPRKIKAVRKFEYIKELLAKKKFSFTYEEIAEAIEKVAKCLKDATPPDPRTVQRWISHYFKSAEDIRVLVDAEKSKGNRNRKFSSFPEISQQISVIIDTAINEIYLSVQQNTKQSVHDLVEYRINKINENRSEDNKLPIPSYNSVCEIISQLDEYEVDKARKGQRYANEKHKTLQKGPEPTRPLERVECDDTRTDLLVVDRETNLPLGRPWLMVLIDVYTKMILGYFLSFYPPSHVTVMMAMKHAIRPKSYIKEKYPDITHSWDTYGLIEVLVVDNAKHWYGKGIEDACYQTGTDLQYAPVRVPWYKGSIERVLKTIHDGLIHKQPGTTFSNILEKGDYDPAKHAMVYLDLLEEILHKWIVDVYSQSIHSGINDIPARRWKNSISKYPPALPPAHTDLDIIFGKIVYRKLTGTVIHFQNLEYSDAVLATLKTNLKKGDDIKIKYDPTDLGMIYVYDAFWCRYVPVPAVDQEYAKGLTEWQHDVICKFIRRTNEARVDRKALAEAKEYIRQRIIQALGERPKKLKAAGKIAKWMAFEDPTEGKIIFPPETGKKPRQSGKSNKGIADNDPKLLPSESKFVPLSEGSAESDELNETGEWEGFYADFDGEES